MTTPEAAAAIDWHTVIASDDDGREQTFTVKAESPQAAQQYVLRTTWWAKHAAAV